MLNEELYNYIPRELPLDVTDVLGTDELATNPEAVTLYFVGFIRGKQQALRILREELENEKE